MKLLNRFRTQRNKAEIKVTKSALNSDVEISQDLIPALVDEYIREHNTTPRFEDTTITFKIDLHELTATMEERAVGKE